MRESDDPEDRTYLFKPIQLQPCIKAIDYKTYKVIDQLARRMERPLRAAFLAAVQSAKNAVTLDTLEAALQAHDPVTAIQAATGGLEFGMMKQTLADIVAAAGTAGNIGLQLQGRLVGAFELTNPWSVFYIQRHSAELVTEITHSTMMGIRELIGLSFEAGIAPRELAQMIRPMIGITSQQAGWVMNYHMRLLDEGAENIDAKVARYGEKLLRYRSMVISRQESLDAANAGQMAAWQAAQVNGYLPNDVNVTWIITDDSRLCDLCEPIPTMDENQEVKVGGLFTLPTGQRIERPPAHVQCLTPDVEVDALEPQLAYRVPFRGWMNVIETSIGRLTIGPNHPVLTPRGFVRAGLLNEGDYVIHGSFGNGEFSINPDKQKRPSTAEEIFKTFSKQGAMFPVVVPTSAEYFHSDASSTHGEVEIVGTNSFLWDQIQTGSSEGQELFFQRRYSRWIRFVRLCANFFFRNGMSTALTSVMRRFYLSDSFFRRHLGPFGRFRFGLISWFNAIANQSQSKTCSREISFFCKNIFAFASQVPFDDVFPIRRVGDSSMCSSNEMKFFMGAQDTFSYKQFSENVVAAIEFIAQRKESFSSKISLTRIGKTKRLWYSGHVYDLQAFAGSYFANGILASNCRCAIALDI